jgi:hypothetical protein
MKNITLAIEDEILDRVRIVAAEKRTSINAMVREFLTEIATRDVKLAKARRDLLKLMDRSTGDMGPDWKWSREETYER